MKRETRRQFRELAYFASIGLSVSLSVFIGLAVGVYLDRKVFHTTAAKTTRKMTSPTSAKISSPALPMIPLSPMVFASFHHSATAAVGASCEVSPSGGVLKMSVPIRCK